MLVRMQSQNRIGPVKCFSLKHTFESAQPLTFYADFDSAAHTLIYSDKGIPITVRQDSSDMQTNLIVDSIEPTHAVKEVSARFRLNDNMDAIYKKINTDRHMEASINAYRGMRLTLNDPWETTLCFIISQFNNVKRIRLITRNIIHKFGEQKEYQKFGKVFSFPTSERLMHASEAELMGCGTGFRAKYIIAAASYCTENLDLNKLRGKSYDKIKSELLEIAGVGDKVADCIALMGYGSLRAFPIDTWIQRTMEKLYFNGMKTSPAKIHEFADDYWGRCAGYAQQYLFHNARSSRPKARIAPKAAAQT